MLTLEDLASISREYADDLSCSVAEFELGGRRFGVPGVPALMGVINLSPDSWYRESVSLTTESAVRRGHQLAAQGAAILDLGAESTLSHAARADAAPSSARRQ